MDKHHTKALSLASVIASVFFACAHSRAQQLVVHALEDGTNKPLQDIPITLRYGCIPVGSGLSLKWQGCKWIQVKTDKAGVAIFPAAGSLPNIDDVYSLPIAYGMTCCDIQPKVFPMEATMRFRKRSVGERLHWIFAGN